MSPDLASQVLAAINQTEQDARAALAYIDRWDWDAPSNAHWARHHPNAVLRRCAADRRIVEAYRLTAEAPELHADAWVVMKDVLVALAEGYRPGEGRDDG